MGRTFCLISVTSFFILMCGCGEDVEIQTYRRNTEICVINVDGTGFVRLTHHPASDSNPSWSPDGTKIAFTSNRDGQSEIYVMNTDGSNLVNLTNNPADDSDPAWSPDGTRMAFMSGRDPGPDANLYLYQVNREIYVMNVDGSNPIRLTNDPAEDSGPAWSPDGAKIAFQSYYDDGSEIRVMKADGTNIIKLTSNSFPDSSNHPSWSPDGTKIAFESQRWRSYVGYEDIFIVNADGTDEIRLTKHPESDSNPSWSPDGTKIAFDTRRDAEPLIIDECGGTLSDPDENREIYMIKADGTDPIRVTHRTLSDTQPSWSPDGTKIAFSSYFK